MKIIQIEGPVSPEELLEILQRTMEEQGSAFRALREAEDETLRRDRQLREEQDAAYLESLKKDKVITIIRWKQTSGSDWQHQLFAGER